MNNIIESIVARLDLAADLNYKDENWGQLQYYGKDCPVKWPCALVDIAGGQFSNIGRDRTQVPENRQEGTLQLEITIASLRLSNSSGRAPVSQKIAAHKIWDITEKVHEVLQGFQPLANSGVLVRMSVQNVRRDDGVQEKRFIYSLGLHNC